jgi:coproporphyrinogen III oxidase
MRSQIEEEFAQIQNEICLALEACDGVATFHEDAWSDELKGRGKTRVIQDGEVFEKGGVNFSASTGILPPAILDHLNIEASNYFATGVSIVIHPRNPWVPIIHMNIRYFETDKGHSWFGGGIDLTPHYLNEADAQEFHQSLKDTCDHFDPEYYPKFKSWADDYFFLDHRNETRGIGGVFFDHLGAEDESDMEVLFQFVCAIGRTFAPTYTAIVNRHKNKKFTAAEVQWQMLRRGRYVEFNLVYDRGTKFGLQTQWRVESILMSLPKYASWLYDYTPAEGSNEECTLRFLKKGVDWLK